MDALLNRCDCNPKHGTNKKFTNNHIVTCTTRLADLGIIIREDEYASITDMGRVVYSKLFGPLLSHVAGESVVLMEPDLDALHQLLHNQEIHKYGSTNTRHI
jgi:hypothetical protein